MDSVSVHLAGLPESQSGSSRSFAVWSHLTARDHISPVCTGPGRGLGRGSRGPHGFLSPGECRVGPRIPSLDESMAFRGPAVCGGVRVAYHQPPRVVRGERRAAVVCRTCPP